MRAAALLLLLPSPASAQNCGDWKDAVTTRYWDCCKASCSWGDNAAAADKPVVTCGLDGNKLDNSEYPSICGGGGATGGPSYMCPNQQPWVVSDTLAYGFAASNLPCSECYQFDFTSTSLANSGKTLVLQVTNRGGDLGQNHFDIQLPGGGFGIFNGCAGSSCTNGPCQFGGSESSWGERYGGLSSKSQCGQLPAVLQPGCQFRFDWFENADNPTARVRRVRCPDELVAISGSRNKEDGSYCPYGPPAPPPPAPTPPPAGCPGGSLSGCMDLCPSSPASAYKDCVNDCVAKCPGSPGGSIKVQ